MPDICRNLLATVFSGDFPRGSAFEFRLPPPLVEDLDIPSNGSSGRVRVAYRWWCTASLLQTAPDALHRRVWKPPVGSLLPRGKRQQKIGAAVSVWDIDASRNEFPPTLVGLDMSRSSGYEPVAGRRPRPGGHVSEKPQWPTSDKLWPASGLSSTPRATGLLYS